MEGSVSLGPARPWAPAMTGCECAGLSFDEVARRVREEGQTLEDVQERTGLRTPVLGLPPRPASPPRRPAAEPG